MDWANRAPEPFRPDPLLRLRQRIELLDFAIEDCWGKEQARPYVQARWFHFKRRLLMRKRSVLLSKLLKLQFAELRDLER